jgi:hypothetical protein
VEDVLLSIPASNLRRCVSLGSKSSPESIVCLLSLVGDILELSCPEWPLSFIQRLPVPGFENLQRLTLARIPFTTGTVIDALLAMRQLSHIADTHSDVHSDFPAPLFKEGLVKLLTHKALERMVFGWIPSPHRNRSVQRDECERFHRDLKASLPTNHQTKLIFVMYGWRRDRRSEMWLVHRILDGTIWELEC